MEPFESQHQGQRLYRPLDTSAPHNFPGNREEKGQSSSSAALTAAQSSFLYLLSFTRGHAACRELATCVPSS